MIRSYKGISPTIPATCYVDESAQVIGDVTLGENASIWMNAVVRGDVSYIRIGANSNIQDGSVLHGMLNQWAVEVGEWVTVGHNVTLHGCVVEDRCLIGMGVIVPLTAPASARDRYSRQEPCCQRRPSSRRVRWSWACREKSAANSTTAIRR
jgi:carbonic anhydrase/acetyltransferase-like protein (isoleucine patch superfamily)